MKNSGAVIDHRFQKIIAIPPTRPKNSCYPYHRRARTSIDARHRHLFPIRRTLSRMVFAKHVYPLRVLCACRAHTRARTHACTVFIDLGPGGNTRFMVSSTTRAGSKFQRGGNSAQITTLWIVYLLVPAFKFFFLFFLFFFFFFTNRNNSLKVIGTAENDFWVIVNLHIQIIIFRIMRFVVILSVSLFLLLSNRKKSSLKVVDPISLFLCR